MNKITIIGFMMFAPFYFCTLILEAFFSTLQGIHIKYLLYQLFRSTVAAAISVTACAV